MTNLSKSNTHYTPRPEFISEADLARRWLHSVRTLQRWRAEQRGLPHLRLGRRIVYRIADVSAFEASLGREDA